MPYRLLPAAHGEMQPLSASAEQLVFEFLADGLSVQVPVTGTSMAPFLRQHDLVTLEPITNHQVSVGDIVAFERAGNRLVLHRVTVRAGDRVRTRGDAAPDDDEWLTRQDLRGRLSQISRQGHNIRFGLGRERMLLAWLSRLGLLAPPLRPLRWLLRSIH